MEFNMENDSCHIMDFRACDGLVKIKNPAILRVWQGAERSMILL